MKESSKKESKSTQKISLSIPKPQSRALEMTLCIVDASRIDSEETDPERGSKACSARLPVFPLEIALALSFPFSPLLKSPCFHRSPSPQAGSGSTIAQANTALPTMFPVSPTHGSRGPRAYPVCETLSPCGLFHGGGSD